MRSSVSLHPDGSADSGCAQARKATSIGWERADGIEMLKQIKSETCTCAAAVVVLTSSEEEEMAMNRCPPDRMYQRWDTTWRAFAHYDIGRGEAHTATDIREEELRCQS
jgi:hypothetical protein